MADTSRDTASQLHPLDAGRLVTGLLGLTLGLLYLVDHAGWVRIDPVVGLAVCWVVLAAVALGRSVYGLIRRRGPG